MSVADIRTNRYAILVCGILTMLMFGTIYAWSIFIPPLEAEFAGRAARTSLVFSVAMIGLSFGMLSIGPLSKVLSLRACFVASTSLIVLGLFSCQFITELWQLYVFYGVCCGLGSGMSYTVWTTNTLAWFGDKVGFASGVLVMGFGMGALVLGSLASALIYSSLGWRLAFVVIAALALVEALVAINFIQEPPPRIAALKPKRDAVGVSLPGSKTVREPSFWLFCIWRSVVMGAGGAVIAEASVMMTGIGSSHRVPPRRPWGRSGWATGSDGRWAASCTTVSGRTARWWLLPALALAVSVGMAAAYWFEAPWLFAPFLLVEGLLYGMYAAINTSYMRTTFGQRDLAMNTGISAVVLAPFNLVFPLVAAALFEWTGGYEAFFVIVPAFALLSLACGALCKPANARLQARYGAAGRRRVRGLQGSCRMPQGRRRGGAPMAWGKGQIVKQALRTAPEDYAAFEAVNLAGARRRARAGRGGASMASTPTSSSRPTQAWRVSWAWTRCPRPWPRRQRARPATRGSRSHARHSRTTSPRRASASTWCTFPTCCSTCPTHRPRSPRRAGCSCPAASWW